MPEKSCKVLSVKKVEVVTRTENAPGEAATEYGKMIRSVCRTHSAECSIPTAFRHLSIWSQLPQCWGWGWGGAGAVLTGYLGR